MPRIPEYGQQTRVAGVGGMGAPVAPFGAQALGGALIDASVTLRAIAERHEAAKAGEALSTLRQRTTEKFIAAQAAAADDAADFTPTVLAEFDRDAGDAATHVNARTSAVREYVKAETRAIREGLYARSLVWESERRVAYRKNSALQSADRLRATLELDPDQWQDAGAEMMELLEGLALDPLDRIDVARHVDAQLTEGAALGMAKRDPEQALANLGTMASGDPRFDGLSADARRRVEQAARAELVDQQVARVVGEYERRGPDAGTAMLADIMKVDLVPAELRAEIRSRVNTQVSALRTQRREEHGDELTALERGIAQGSAGDTTHGSVEDLYTLGALSASERANYHAAIDNSIVQQAKANAGAAEISAALSAGLPLDPRDPDQRKAFGAAFTQDVSGYAVGDAAWQATAQAYTQAARMLPDPALSWARASLRSPDPAVASNGASFYGAIAATTPEALGELDADTKAIGGVISTMIEAGTDPATAVETARATVLEVSKDVRERREHAWSSAGIASLNRGSEMALRNYIDRDYDPGWLSPPPAAADERIARTVGARMLQPDFDRLSRQYYLKTGDVNVARDLAWQDVRRVYGPSEVNGEPAMMAFPPERFGVSPPEVRDELAAFIKANPQADESTAADLVVVPDSITLRQVTNAYNGQAVRPSYLIIGKTGDVVLDQNGIPQRYTVPSADELSRRIRDREAAAAAESQARVDKARAAREKREQERRAFAEQIRSGYLPGN